MTYIYIVRKYCLFLIITANILIVNVLFSQAPDTLWTRIYGTISYDHLLNVAPTSDSQFITTGTKWTSSGNKTWLIKFNTDGDTLWTKIYGLASTINVGYDVKPLSGGGYIITGYKSPFSSRNADLQLTRTNNTGDTIWIRTFGGDTTDYCFSVDETADHGYITTGYTESFGSGGDLWLIKVDSLGDWQFSKNYGGSFMDMGNSVRTTADSGFIVCGYNSSFSLTGMDGWLLKTNSFGDTTWTKSISHGFYDNLFSVRPLTDHGYILTGWAILAETLSADLSLIRTDSMGNVLWTKLYGGDQDDVGMSAEPLIDGGFIVCGYTNSYGNGGQDIWVLRTDSLGDTLWTKTIGGSSTDQGWGVTQTTDNGYIITGYTASYGAGLNDGWIIKLGYHGGIENSSPSLVSSRIKVLGNPVRTRPAFDIYLPTAMDLTLKIYDAAGRLAAVPYAGHMAAGNHVLRGPYGLNAGVYFYRLETSAGSLIGKVVIIK